jgi:class 3 adenylate cyclase/tetratricopeptide (TPR) repeat protein
MEMSQTASMHFPLYLPRTLLAWQADPDAGAYTEFDGTLVFSDISGFTALSEQLAKKGRVGAEEITQVLNAAFTELLNVAALDGGDLLKFGGDALLHVFSGDGHAARAARSSFEMRNALDDYQSSNSPTPLSMSVGLASGLVQFFLAGSTNRELVVAGPTASLVAEMEGAADSGQILMAPATAESVDDIAIGDSRRGGFLLVHSPDSAEWDEDEEFGDETTPVDYGSFISARLRKHLTLTFNEGEHRMANVGFVKLTGFDALLAKDGPERAGAELNDTVTAVQEAAERFGVCFLQSDISADGTKLILTSGVPERRDGDMERMLRSVHATLQIASPFPLHIGVATGGVFAGDLGARTRRVYTVMGDTVNLAARLCGAAAPGQALITERLAVEAEFSATALEPIELKGKSQPTTAYLLGDPTAGTTTLSDQLLPLIGRDAEFSQLSALLATATAGRGRVVDVVGRSGVGKTRLLLALANHAHGVPTFVATGEPYEANTAYFVFGQFLRTVLGIDSSPEESGDRLSQVIRERSPDLTPWAPLVARVVGATVPATPEVEALDDGFQESKTAEIVAQLLTALVPGPALAFIDGAQWIDDASRTLLDKLVPTIKAQPWLVVIGRRPDVGWEEFAGSDEDTIELGPLDDAATAALAAAALGEEAVPAPKVDAIVTRSGGNPFFLLELVAAAIRGEQELPTSVEAAVAARIDRLQLKDRRLLGFAAVLGQRFSLDLLADALPEAAAAVDGAEAWERLSEFIAMSVSGEMRFRHPIVRDVAYEGLPFERRRDLHRAIGEALERRARNRPQRFAELLSIHFDQAEDFAKAWNYSVMAAERARRKYANVDAADLYKRALAAEERMEGDATPAEKVAIAEALGDVTEVVGLYGDAEAAYLMALGIIGDAGLDAGRILLKRGTLRERTADYDDGLAILAQVPKALQGAGGDADEILLESIVETAAIRSRQGAMEDTVVLCTDVIERADPALHRQVIAHAYYLIEFAYTRLNHPNRGTVGEKAAEIYRDLGDLVRLGNVLNNLGYDAFYLGKWDQAYDYWTEAKETRDKAGDIVGSALQENNIAEIHTHRGNYLEARRLLEHALRVWRGAGYEIGVAYANANLGLLASRQGQPEEARRHLDEAFGGFTAAGAEAYLPDVRVRYAEFLLAHGDAVEAEAMLAPDIAASTESGDSLALSTLYRLRGIARHQLGDREAARADLELSLDLARKADARYDEVLALDALEYWSVSGGAADSGWGDQARPLIDSLGIGEVSGGARLMGKQEKPDGSD